MNSYLPFIGRVLIGLPFAMSGLTKLAAYSPTTDMIAAVGLPFPTLAFAVAVAVELGGALLLVPAPVLMSFASSAA
jgi:putative oxidoreductase